MGFRSASMLCQIVDLLKTLVFYAFILMVVLRLFGVLPVEYNKVLMYYLPLGVVGLYILDDYAACEIGKIKPGSIEVIGGHRRHKK